MFDIDKPRETYGKQGKCNRCGKENVWLYEIDFIIHNGKIHTDWQCVDCYIKLLKERNIRTD